MQVHVLSRAFTKLHARLSTSTRSVTRSRAALRVFSRLCASTRGPTRLHASLTVRFCVQLLAAVHVDVRLYGLSCSITSHRAQLCVFVRFRACLSDFLRLCPFSSPSALFEDFLRAYSWNLSDMYLLRKLRVSYSDEAVQYETIPHCARASHVASIY